MTEDFDEDRYEVKDVTPFDIHVLSGDTIYRVEVTDTETGQTRNGSSIYGFDAAVAVALRKLLEDEDDDD